MIIRTAIALAAVVLAVCVIRRRRRPGVGEYFARSRGGEAVPPTLSCAVLTAGDDDVAEEQRAMHPRPFIRDGVAVYGLFIFLLLFSKLLEVGLVDPPAGGNELKFVWSVGNVVARRLDDATFWVVAALWFVVVGVRGVSRRLGSLR